MLTIPHLEARVKAMAEDRFPPGTVEAVHCRRDLDHEEDPVVWVRSVLADNRMPLDPTLRLAFGVALRLAFDDWGETGYPVTFFHSESEYGKRHPAAA